MRLPRRAHLLLILVIGGLLSLTALFTAGGHDASFPEGEWRNALDFEDRMHFRRDGTYDARFNNKRDSGRWDEIEGWMRNDRPGVALITDAEIQAMEDGERRSVEGNLRRARFLRLTQRSGSSSRDFLVLDETALVEFDIWGRPKPWLVWAWECAVRWYRNELPPPSRVR